MILRDIIESFDAETQQDQTNMLSARPDNYRISKRKWIISTLNQNMKRFAQLNPVFFENVQEMQIESNTLRVKIPFSFIKLNGVREENYSWQRVYSPNSNTPDAFYISDYNNHIKKANGEYFNEGILYLHGFFFPTKIEISDDEEFDNEQVVDFPEQFERLLVLALVIAHNSKEKIDNGYQYSEYKKLLGEFQRSNSTSQPVASVDSAIFITSGSY